MKKTLKFIIGIIIGFVLVIIVSLLIGLFAIQITIGKVANTVSNKIEVKNAETKTREENFKSINDELNIKGLIPYNWKYIDKEYAWEFESPNKKRIYYFYIDEENYDSYKNYWLEDIDYSDYCTDETDSTTYKNANLNQFNLADHVFHSVYISEIDDSSNKSTQYLVTIYNKALYYKKVSTCNHTEKTYIISGKYEIDADSFDKTYIFYKENNNWVIKENEK